MKDFKMDNELKKAKACEQEIFSVKLDKRLEKGLPCSYCQECIAFQMQVQDKLQNAQLKVRMPLREALYKHLRSKMFSSFADLEMMQYTKKYPHHSIQENFSNSLSQMILKQLVKVRYHTLRILVGVLSTDDAR